MNNQSGNVKKKHENPPGVVQGGYGWLQVVTGGLRRLQGESDHFLLQTHRHFIMIYVSLSFSNVFAEDRSEFYGIIYPYSFRIIMITAAMSSQKTDQIFIVLE